VYTQLAIVILRSVVNLIRSPTTSILQLSHICNNNMCKLVFATSELFSKRSLQNALCRASPPAIF